jgi:heterodisulfide reductase subunit C
MEPDQHPEQGPVWEWMVHNASQVYGRFDETFDRVGGSLLRKPGPQTRLELQRIFEVTGE